MILSQRMGSLEREAMPRKGGYAHRKLAALLDAMSQENDVEVKQVFLEMAMSLLSDKWPEFSKVAWSLICAAEGRDYSTTDIGLASRSSYTGDLFCDLATIELDLFILTIKVIELGAVLDAFAPGCGDSGLPDASYTDPDTDRSVWVVDYKGLRIGIGCVFRDGMSESAIAIADYRGFLDFRKVCMIGMAGGHESIDIGSVVIPDLVTDCDRRRVVPEICSDSDTSRRSECNAGGCRKEVKSQDKERATNTPEQRFVVVPAVDNLANLENGVALSDWWKNVLTDYRRVLKGRKEASEDERRAQAADIQSRFSIKVKPLLSGGALIEVREEFERLRAMYSSEAIAVDMESYGFARWCALHLAKNQLEEFGKIESWLILRGISDHCAQESISKADGSRAERPKYWQHLATYRAARLLRDHLIKKHFHLL